MAYDKVIDSAQLEAEITATANAIREKTGDTALIDWIKNKGFEDAVKAIESGGSDVLIGDFTLSSDDISFGLEIEQPNGYKNETVPKFVAFFNASDFLSTASGQSEIKCLFGCADSVYAYRFASALTGTGSSAVVLNGTNAQDVCRWYGVKLWMYGSKNANFNAFRAGDTYKYIIVL